MIRDVDPLTCAKCEGRIKIPLFTEDEKIRLRSLARPELPNPATSSLHNIMWLNLLWHISKSSLYSADKKAAFYQIKTKPVSEDFKSLSTALQRIKPPKGPWAHHQLCTGPMEKFFIVYGICRLSPNNTAADNTILRFVVGRKNGLFAGHRNGAESGATFSEWLKQQNQTDCSHKVICMKSLEIFLRPKPIGN